MAAFDAQEEGDDEAGGEPREHRLWNDVPRSIHLSASCGNATQI